MFLVALPAILIGAFVIVYRFLNHSLVGPFFNFAKGVEFVIALGLAVAFFLLSVAITLRQAKRLPDSYAIEVSDIFGRSSTVEGVRLSFTTYSAAESYARLYRETYNGQYQFKVIGMHT